MKYIIDVLLIVTAVALGSYFIATNVDAMHQDKAAVALSLVIAGSYFLIINDQGK
jgi:hypothetical protein